MLVRFAIMIFMQTLIADKAISDDFPDRHINDLHSIGLLRCRTNSLGLKVERIYGEQFRKALVEMNSFDRSRKIRSDDSHIYLPVLEMGDQSKARLRQIAEFELLQLDFEQEEHIQTLEEKLGFRPSFEVVGDIAMVEDSEAEKVALALMSTSKNIKTVIAPISDVEGEFRTRRFRHVAGEPGTVTTHKEHGLRYRVDLEGAYFTPRLGTERLRIAGLVHPPMSCWICSQESGRSRCFWPGDARESLPWIKTPLR